MTPGSKPPLDHLDGQFLSFDEALAYTGLDRMTLLDFLDDYDLPRRHIPLARLERELRNCQRTHGYDLRSFRRQLRQR